MDRGVLKLSNDEKLLTIAVVMGFLTLTILLTVCVVTPVCWLHTVIHRNKAKDKKCRDVELQEEATPIKRTVAPHYGLQSNRSSRVTSESIAGRKKYTEDSTYSSMSASSRGDGTISLYSELSLDIPIPNEDMEANYGQVVFSVVYRQQQNQNEGQLILYLKEAQDLPSRIYGGIIDPYLLVQIIKDRGHKRRIKGRSVPYYEFRSSTKRKSQHPLFRETVIVNMLSSQLKDYVLRIAVVDEEKIVNDTILGEISIPLREFHLEENHVHVLDLLEPKQDNGDILFGLSYLPTAERLTFTVVKGNNFRVVTDDVDTFAPYVRVLLFHNGKMLKKRKTSSRLGTECPSYNESLTFDVPLLEMENVMFIVAVSHRDTTLNYKHSTSPKPVKRDKHVGKVVIGPHARGSAFHHWLAMKKSPRKQVTQWHTIH
ncbi:synaptotagmin-1-like isoform X2 [Limulus polyphemus]|uniref:Synaptotagmin-1-like isoform X2 n=1 Tax=Limulus polyphemus TaxID=6850 RepID=A0ABM1SLM5_LIMPO|nr:synaptotagmin-1-like isoform X2 [Limulus polyphemus]